MSVIDETLDLSSSNLKYLGEIPEGVRFLYLNDNQLTKLPKLPESLEILDVSNNQLTKLPKLPESLYNLDVSNNQLIKIPKPGYMLFFNISHNQLTSFPKFTNVELLRAEYNPISEHLYEVKNLNNISKEYLNGEEYFTYILRKGTILFHNMRKMNEIFNMYVGYKKDNMWSISPDHQAYFFLHPFNITYGDITTINVLTKDVKLLYLLNPSKIMKYNKIFLNRDNCKKDTYYVCIKDELREKNILGWIGHDTTLNDKGYIWHGENKNFLKYHSYVSYYKNYDGIIDRPEISMYPFPKFSDDYVSFKDEDVFGIKDNGKIWLENNEHLFNYKTIAIIENSKDFKKYKKVMDSLLSPKGLDGYRIKRNEDDGLYSILDF